MRYDNKILSILLDKYEASEVFTKGYSRRRVIYKPESDQELIKKIADPLEKEEFFKIVYQLKKQNLIDFDWVRFEENNLIKNIWLITEENSLVESYELCQRTPKDELAAEILQLFREQSSVTKTQWILDLFEAILEEAEIVGKSWRFALSLRQTKEVCKVLALLDSCSSTNIDKRILSVNLFSDSKYFERYVQKKLLQVIARYLLEWYNDLTDREKLQQMGIGFAPEILYFTGPIELVLENNEKINYTFFSKGNYLGVDMLSEIKRIDCHYSKVVTIENLANYYWYIHNERDCKTLVIYTGGFLTRHQSTFLKLLKLEKDTELLHWGDIDLGGFRILLQIQTILPEIQSLKMDVATFEQYSKVRKKVSKEYIQKIKVCLKKKEFKPFKEVLEKIVEHEQILEQEAELYF